MTAGMKTLMRGILRSERKVTPFERRQAGKVTARMKTCMRGILRSERGRVRPHERGQER